MSSLYRRGKVWCLQWTDPGGRCVQRSLRTTDERLARHLKRQHDAAATLGRLAPTGRPAVPLDDLAAQWLDSRAYAITEGTQRIYHSLLRLVMESCRQAGIATADQLDRHAAEGLVQTWSAEGLGGKTIGNRIMALRLVISYGVDHGLCEMACARWPKVAARAVRPERLQGYSAAEVAAILAYMQEHYPDLWPHYMVLAYTGARSAEAMEITAADVDLPGRVLRLANKKTARTPGDAWRSVKIHRELVPVLRTMLDGKRPADRVLPWQNSTRYLIWPLERACRMLGIQYRRVHGLRHSWITRMLEAGAPLAVVMAQAGHTQLATTQRYLHVSREASDWVDRL